MGTFSEFIEQYDDLTDEAKMRTFKLIVEEIKRYLDDINNVTLLDLFLEDFGDILIEIENGDGFGTEGMRL